jgi:hypothetical protein
MGYCSRGVSFIFIFVVANYEGLIVIIVLAESSTSRITFTCFHYSSQNHLPADALYY